MITKKANSKEFWLTEHQKERIIKNYFKFETRQELADAVGCSLNQIQRTIAKVSIEDIPIDKRKEVDKMFDEPKDLHFSIEKEETLVLLSITETINGKKCNVFQSRMNYFN